MSNFTIPTSIIPNLTNWCPISVQTFSVITRNDPKMETNQTMSKIYKLYINGKPKRPGTQKYPYLGPKVAMVAEKLDPIVGQICFRRIFQTVRNLRKGTTGMSSKGPKMGGGRYGSALNGRKTSKSGDLPWLPPPRSPA